MFLRSIAMAAGLVAVCGSVSVVKAGPAFIVAPKRVSTLSNPPDNNAEPAIVASPTNLNVVLMGWQHSGTLGTTTVAYASSNDGLQTLQFGSAAVPYPPNLSCTVTVKGDAMVAASRRTGDVYLGCLLLSATGEDAAGAMVIGRRDPVLGSLTDLTQMIPCGTPDKCFMAIGPQASGDAPNTEHGYVGYTSGTFLRTARSLASTIPATQWPLSGQAGSPTPVRSNGGAAQIGIGAFPCVLGDNSTRSGRLWLAYSPSTGHMSKPELTASDVGGGANQSDWNIQVSADRRLDTYFDPVLQVPLAILGTGGVDGPPSLWNVPLPGAADARTMPSVAEDPRAGQGDVLLVAFTGRLPSDTQRLVVFVAESTNAADLNNPTFDVGTSTATARRWALTGTMLGVTGASVWMPSIAIDNLGGVNLLFAWTTDIGHCSMCQPPRTRIRFVRWASIADLAAANPPPFAVDVSPEFLAWDGAVGNEYVMLSTSGCHIYATWAQQTVAGQWDVYAAHLVADIACITEGPSHP